jgi:hypothetical protein
MLYIEVGNDIDNIALKACSDLARLRLRLLYDRIKYRLSFSGMVSLLSF